MMNNLNNETMKELTEETDSEYGNRIKYYNKVYQGDSAKLMKEIPNNFIDLTVTSPPYDNLREYKGYSFDFETIARELYRTTKKGGIVVWVVGDATINGSETGTSFRQALYFMNVGFNLHDTMIYAKENYLPDGIINRYCNGFEYMFVFSKGKPKTFNFLTIKSVFGGKTLHRTNSKHSHSSRYKEYHKPIAEEKKKSNIWFYKIGTNCSTKDRFTNEHPAIFPEALAKDHILSWSNEKDLVFDPFAGSGTTLKMAKLMNRNYLGFEIAEEYIALINKRIAQETVGNFFPAENIIAVSEKTAITDNDLK